MGESFGNYSLGKDQELLEFVTSASIACGYHAGDPSVMRATVHHALSRGVAIGAHPGYRDLQGFGRRFMSISPGEVLDMVVYQLGALNAFVRAEGESMRHVKAHGALYNAAVVDGDLADAIARAVHSVDPSLILFGLSGSELIAAGEAVGLPTASEAFADRTYQGDGTLTPRTHPDALIVEPEQAVRQTIRLAKEGRVRSQSGNDVEVQADTICIHGDGPHALQFARSIREGLEAAGIEVKPVGVE
jgi:5-oxoprolinase (ATP-hydrolysing) subunit A